MLGSGPSGGPGGRAASGRTRPGSARTSGGHPSIVQHAVSLVLNHPASALEADVARLAGVARKGTDLLASLIETVQTEPNISTAGLVERYRHDEQGRYLGRLAAAELPADEDFDAATELADCLAQLELLGRKERIAFLIEKRRVNGLTDDEKAELQALLRAAQLDAVYIDSALP